MNVRKKNFALIITSRNMKGKRSIFSSIVFLNLILYVE